MPIGLSNVRWAVLLLVGTMTLFGIQKYYQATRVIQPKVFSLASYYEPVKPIQATNPAEQAAQLSTPTSLAAKDTSKVLQARSGETELTNLRTATSNSFKLPNGQIRMAASVGSINYKINPTDVTEPYKQIDLTIATTPDQPWQYAMEHNGYQARFWTTRQIKGEDVKYVAQYQQGGQWLEMAPVVLEWENAKGESQVISKPLTTGEPTIDNDNYTITWKDVFGPGIDFRYNVGTEKFFKTVIVNKKDALPAANIDPTGLKLSVVMALDWSQNAKPNHAQLETAKPNTLNNQVLTDTPTTEVQDPTEFNYQDNTGLSLWWMQQPKAWDSSNQQTSGPQIFKLN